MEGFPLLTTVLFLPLLGALVLAFFNRARENLFMYFACVVSLANFLLSFILYFRFDGSTANFQFVD